MDRKMVPLYRDKREMELWQRAETKARQEIDGDVREGVVLAHICEQYLDNSVSQVSDAA